MITNDMITLSKAVKDDRVHYSMIWVRNLCKEGKIDAQKFGEGKGAIWMVSLSSLLQYIEKMERLGTSKHAGQK